MPRSEGSSRRKAACVTSLVNRVLTVPVGRAEPPAERSAPQPGGRSWLVDGRRRVLRLSCLSRRVFNAAYGVRAPFVGDDAGGNRSLVRVCFHRLKRPCPFTWPQAEAARAVL
jgi:hypothetical protein